MNLGVGSGLNRRTPGMAAQFWDDMGRYMITYKTKMRGSKVKDLVLVRLVRVDKNDASTVAEKKFY